VEVQDQEFQNGKIIKILQTEDWERDNVCFISNKMLRQAPDQAFWGLVKQVGPWAEAPTDKLRRQTGIEKLVFAQERPFQQNGSGNLPPSSLVFTGDGGRERNVNHSSVVTKSRLNRRYGKATKPDFDLRLMNKGDGGQSNFDKPTEPKSFEKPGDDDGDDGKDNGQMMQVEPENFYDAQTGYEDNPQQENNIVEPRMDAIKTEDLPHHDFNVCDNWSTAPEIVMEVGPVSVPVVVTNKPMVICVDSYLGGDRRMSLQSGDDGIVSPGARVSPSDSVVSMGSRGSIASSGMDGVSSIPMSLLVPKFAFTSEVEAKPFITQDVVETIKQEDIKIEVNGLIIKNHVKDEDIAIVLKPHKINRRRARAGRDGVAALSREDEIKQMLEEGWKEGTVALDGKGYVTKSTLGKRKGENTIGRPPKKNEAGERIYKNTKAKPKKKTGKNGFTGRQFGPLENNPIKNAALKPSPGPYSFTSKPTKKLTKINTKGHARRKSSVSSKDVSGPFIGPIQLRNPYK
jgi:hypothetical protein